MPFDESAIVPPFVSKSFSVHTNSKIDFFRLLLQFLRIFFFSEVIKIQSDALNAVSTKNKPHPSQHNIRHKQPIPGSSAELNNQKGSNVNICYPSTSPCKQPGEFGHLKNTSRQSNPSTALLQHLQRLARLQPPATESKPSTQTVCDVKPVSMPDSKMKSLLTGQLSVSGMSSNVILINGVKSRWHHFSFVEMFINTKQSYIWTHICKVVNSHREKNKSRHCLITHDTNSYAYSASNNIKAMTETGNLIFDCKCQQTIWPI